MVIAVNASSEIGSMLRMALNNPIATLVATSLRTQAWLTESLCGEVSISLAANTATFLPAYGCLPGMDWQPP